MNGKCIGLLAAALLAGTQPAMAQSPTDVASEAPPATASDAATGAEELGILVEAPRRLPPPPERSAYSGAPIVTTTIKISALYGDLDLRRPGDADRLMTRIGRVARDACGYLDRIYPLNPDATCVDRAIANATPAARALIASAAK
jgi:UrcA family protein